MDLDEFRAQAHSFSDWMADYLASVESLPRFDPQVNPGEILSGLPEACPERGEPMEHIFADF